MTLAQYPLFPRLKQLPDSLPDDGSINIRLEDGVPIFRASTSVQERIGILLDKQRKHLLTPAEAEELDQYEEIDDYLSYLNRLVRNLLQTDAPSLSRS